MTPHEYNRAICQALGIEPTEVTGIRITMRPHKFPQVQITRAARVEGKLVDVLSEATLVPTAAQPQGPAA